MKIKRTLSITAIIMTSAAITTFVIFRNTQNVQAQDTQPLPAVQRISFGMVGITAGQTARLSIANTIMPNDSLFSPDTGQRRVSLSFRDINGNLIRNAKGEVIRRSVDVQRGDSTFLDLNYDELPPGPTRLQFRAVVTIIPPPNVDEKALQDGVCIPTVEVINNANGRTQFAVSADPAVVRGFTGNF
jgi:hypothetical protein